ncbi:hypothetical protein B0A49_10408 [Cryomyces minteri]|uniref:KOW domain-containing protein n=1 Tax=Cryomyces minteri TaxID=331657 RepID=A0A4U0WIT7_9PEZI|nr:hypothetical protein B0A49_10408 [Cryomyces minteri]
MAKRQAARRALLRTQKEEADTARTKTMEKIQSAKEESRVIKEARRNRREDWDLGPLAPRRDVGENKQYYGTVNQNTLRGVEIPKKKRTELWTIVEGDRVVLLTGRDKGKIGEVESVNKETEEVEIAIPEWMRGKDSNPSPTRSVERPIPLALVRLVYALPDPKTSIPRDVIVENIERRNVFRDKYTKETVFDRVIPGLEVSIPWPTKVKPEDVDHPSDTLRITVEEQTWTPTLLRPPMPPSVIDELRNKYSAFRDRHDEEYIAKKMAEDEEAKAAKQTAKMMRTPLKELHAKRREEFRKGSAEGARPKKITQDMLARIGEVIVAKSMCGLSGVATTAGAEAAEKNTPELAQRSGAEVEVPETSEMPRTPEPQEALPPPKRGE